MKKRVHRIPVIIDTDPGVDDALALKLAFAAPELDVRLVCSVAGNVNIDRTTANALYLTKRYGGKIPVVKGSAAPLSRQATDAASVHGESGIGNYVLPAHSYRTDGTDGAEAMRRTLVYSRKKITLITLGPLTNVAKLLTDHPEVKEKIRSIYAMIASVDGTGNITQYAEFNAYCDPEALDAVICSGVKIVFAPMHLGRDTKLDQNSLLERDRDGEFGAMLQKVFEGYRDDAAGDGYVAMYDANAVLALIRPDCYRFVRCTAQVNTDDRPGQTYLSPDPNGNYRTLEVRAPEALRAAMLDGIFR